jgi:hypothetical protein
MRQQRQAATNSDKKRQQRQSRQAPSCLADCHLWLAAIPTHGFTCAPVRRGLLKNGQTNPVSPACHGCACGSAPSHRTRRVAQQLCTLCSCVWCERHPHQNPPGDSFRILPIWHQAAAATASTISLQHCRSAESAACCGNSNRVPLHCNPVISHSDTEVSKPTHNQDIGTAAAAAKQQGAAAHPTLHTHPPSQVNLQTTTPQSVNNMNPAVPHPVFGPSRLSTHM